MIDKKFRVWNPVTKIMHFYKAGEPFLIQHHGRSCVVMAFIGAVDRNGKDIYECDIVTHRLLDKPTDKVLYGSAAHQHSEAFPKMIVAYKDFGFYPFRLFMEDTFHDLEWEVLGNVFESGIFEA